MANYSNVIYGSPSKMGNTAMSHSPKSQYKEEPFQLELPLVSIDDEREYIRHLTNRLETLLNSCFTKAINWESLRYDIDHNNQLKEMWTHFQFTRQLICMGQ